MNGDAKAWEFEPIEDPDTAAEFAEMTYPAYRPLVLENGPGLRLAARYQGQPVGLAVAFPQQPPDAEVLSIFVVPEMRSQGLGTAMLQVLEGSLRDYGVERLQFVYPTGKPITPAVERMLGKAGWPAPRPRMLLFTTRVDQASIERLQQAGWFHKTQSPRGCEVFAWSELKPSEAESMRRQQAEAEWYPEMLSPFNEPEAMDRQASLGVRFQGRVVGWFVCHRTSEDTLRYTSLFVRSDVTLRGVGFYLLAEAIRRLVAQPQQVRLATFGIHATNPVAGFVERRVVPYLNLASKTTTHESIKTLAGDP